MGRTIKLELAKSLTDLQNQAKPLVKALTTASSSKLIISSADKIFSEAVLAEKKGDPERAYFYFFRYLETLAYVQKRDDYQKERDFFKKLVGSKFKTALDTVERLQPLLEENYEKSYGVGVSKSSTSASKNGKDSGTFSAASNGVTTKSSGDPSKKTASVNGVIKANGVEKAKQESGDTTPQELKNLLEQKTKRVLLVDCRDTHDFLNNHINHSNCISIPLTILHQGMTANSILNALKEGRPESYHDWRNRGSFDHIILYDWNSNFEHRQPIVGIVYDALVKWDPENKNTYKVSIMQGGMKTMYYTYPFLLTNPQTGVANSSKANGSGSSLDTKGLDDIAYPDMDDPKPRVELIPSVDLNTNVPTSNFITSGVDVPKNVVSVDRSTKPTRKVMNGTGGHTEVSSEMANLQIDNNNAEKTDAPVQQYTKVLDEVIKDLQGVTRIESEVSDLQEKAMTEKNNEELAKRLAEKEKEVEELQKLIASRNEQLKKYGEMYVQYQQQEKAIQYLPSIRPPQDQKEVEVKEKEKRRLDELVTKLRQERKLKEEQKKLLEQRSERLPVIPQSATTVPSVPKLSLGSTHLPAIHNSIPASPPPAVPSTSLKPIPTTSSIIRPVSQDAGGVTRMPLKDEPSEHPRSTSLKRSHSHPNIAQSHDEGLNSVSSGSQPPRFNRGLKPSGPRAAPEPVLTPRNRSARNFEVVSSTDSTVKTGLKNLGNTCYMNSIIQCLAHTTKLVEYLRRQEYVDEWHPHKSPTKGEATEELAAAVKQMHSGHRSISLLDLKETIGRYQPSFRGSEQQDSHEFLTIVLDWLHEELNRASEKKPLLEQKNDGLSDEDAANRAWDDYKKSNNSKISELFCGQQKSCVTCGNCNRESVTFEPFFILSVPIPAGGKKCDIQQCIDFYTTEEELFGWNCIHCKRKVRATKKIDLWRLPPYLIIHLQRFYYDGYWKKRLAEVDFPVENLNMNQKALGKATSAGFSSFNYQLYGVSNHYGTMDGGHYTAYCRNPVQNNWLKFDDSDVASLNSRDVPTVAAYILFYQNKNIL